MASCVRSQAPFSCCSAILSTLSHDLIWLSKFQTSYAPSVSRKDEEGKGGTFSLEGGLLNATYDMCLHLMG
jgi:hypothetical protein